MGSWKATLRTSRPAGKEIAAIFSPSVRVYPDFEGDTCRDTSLFERWKQPFESLILSLMAIGVVVIVFYGLGVQDWFVRHFSGASG